MSNGRIALKTPCPHSSLVLETGGPACANFCNFPEANNPTFTPFHAAGGQLSRVWDFLCSSLLFFHLLDICLLPLPRRLCFQPCVSVCCLVCRIAQKLLNDFRQALMEDETQHRIDPVNFWFGKTQSQGFSLHFHWHCKTLHVSTFLLTSWEITDFDGCHISENNRKHVLYLVIINFG